MTANGPGAHMSTEPRERPSDVPTEVDRAGSPFAAGDRSRAAGDRPFLLSAADAWLVLEGQVDVFTVRVREGRAHGPRTHLLRVRPGQALFGTAGGAGPDGWGLLAVGAGPAELSRVSQAALPGGNGRTAALVARWIHLLYAALTRDKLPAISVELSPGREIEVAESASVRPASDLIWLRHPHGYTRLMGRRGLELEAEGFTPVSRAAWLEAGATSRLAAVEAQDLPSRAEVWAGLARLHDLVLRHAALATAAAERDASDRLDRKTTMRQAILHDACGRLAATMMRADPASVGPAPGVARAPEESGDPLFAAAVLVGSALGIGVQRDHRPPGSVAPRDPLAAVLRASRVRSRRVALRGRWWHDDNGPLLAYTAGDHRPVALLRRGASGPYVLHDPEHGTERTVLEAAAETLEPFAVSFYRPLPERALRLRDLVRFCLFRGRRDIAVVIGLALGGALLGMVPSLATARLFNTIIPGVQRDQLPQMFVVLLACAVTSALFNLASGVALLRIESRGSAALQAADWDRLLALPLPFFRPYTSGELAMRAMSVEGIRQAVSGATVSAFLGVVLAAGNFCLMYWYSPDLARWGTLIIAVVVCLTAAGSYLQLRPQREATRQQAKISGLVLQLLGGIAKLRVAAAEVHAFALWARHFSEQRRVQYQSRNVSNWLAAVNGTVPILANLAIFSLALPLIKETRDMQTGDFLAFLSAFGSCSGAVVASSLALLTTISTIPLYEQAKPILEALPEVDVGKTDPGVLTGDIEVKHVVFRYQHDGPLVLRDVSFHVRAGEFVAVVGPSGSGKSTLLRLLLGFEAPETGSIYYDGQELGSINVQAVRRQMGVVLQTGRLMSGELYMNIVGASAASLEEAWEAARMAGLDEDIRQMPMGMHTVVSEGGSTLSGGQRQRLLIARAIVNRPRILLFDEATSALDNRTQAIVSASLESLQATRIVIAHRLSTIVNADRILVIDKGQLVQSGTYRELMSQAGPFALLAKRQIA
jgi:NHLM bacteriocin system ABC transporter ATP-binding protein